MGLATVCQTPGVCTRAECHAMCFCDIRVQLLPTIIAANPFSCVCSLGQRGHSGPRSACTRLLPIREPSTWGQGAYQMGLSRVRSGRWPRKSSRLTGCPSPRASAGQYSQLKGARPCRTNHGKAKSVQSSNVARLTQGSQPRILLCRFAERRLPGAG